MPAASPRARSPRSASATSTSTSTTTVTLTPPTRRSSSSASSARRSLGSRAGSYSVEPRRYDEMMGTNAWTIGRFRGVEIRIDPSWSVIAFLVGYSFYVLLSFRFPDIAGTGRLTLALVMTLVFFLGVLVHEIAHAWTALARGIEVHSITLYMFGGATHAELETENPSDELIIAGVGPLTSLAIAALLWVVSLLAGETAIGYAAGYLGWINLALAVFNLVPGFPLDGGRVLRSLVWKANNDFVAATRLASRVGHAVGF